MGYVIIGNSAGAIGCIEGIRQVDKNGHITLISSELPAVLTCAGAERFTGSEEVLPQMARIRSDMASASKGLRK